MTRQLTEISAELDAKAVEIRSIADQKRDASLVDALKFYWHLKEAYNELDTIRKKIYATLDEFDKAVLPAKFSESGQDLARIPELGRSFYPTDKFSARTVDKDALFEWLRARNQGEIITETVNAQTLAGVLKTLMLEEGIEAPEDIAVLTKYQTIGSSKYTPK